MRLGNSPEALFVTTEIPAVAVERPPAFEKSVSMEEAARALHGAPRLLAVNEALGRRLRLFVCGVWRCSDGNG